LPGRNKLATAFLGLGGNLGDPRSAMASALQAIDAVPEIAVRAVSSLYKTPPWGKTDQPDFLNAVACVETRLKPRALLEACLAAEKALKRVRLERWGPRVIDIDVLWFEGRTVDEPGLQIPHPRMLERAFVMAPLAEIVPDLMLDDRSAGAIAEALDRSGIEKVTTDGDWWRD
jgi:2-amino-4-hydroxy-6-hydroxymethyldihydropteridine diphosphokinase